MRRISLTLLLLSLAVPAFAAKKPCPCPKVHHRTARPCTTVVAQPCTTVVQAPAPEKASESSRAYAGGLYDALVDGFSLTTGFRWDRACPDKPGISHEDPFFFGVEERLPINSGLELGGNFDRDFTDAPHWSARVYLAAHPWRK
jgi:hypothetical protein